MTKKYPDCIRDDGDCTQCSLVNYGRDCHNKSLSRYASQTAWNTANTKLIQLKLNNRTDVDILQRLDEVENKQGYIKRLIREDMARGTE